MLISAELATANIAMNGITLSIGKSGSPAETTLVSGVSPSPSSLDRHQRHREDRDEHVDHPGDADAGEHHLREVAHRVLGLLGHVHGILEADHREEGDRRGRRDREEDVLVARGVEHGHLREVGLAPGRGVDADEDDEEQAGELDEGEHDVGLDALTDPAEVHRRDEQHEGQRDAEHQGAVLGVEPEAVGEVGGEGVATPSTPR